MMGLRLSHCSGFSCWGAWALRHASFSSCGAWAYMFDLPKGSTLNVNGTLAIIGSADKETRGTLNVAGTVSDSNGKFTNEGTINVTGSGDVTVNTNNGVVNMEANTARVTITAGKGKVKNTNLAYVKANTTQAVYYEVTSSINNKKLEELDETIAGYGINTLNFSAPVNINGNLHNKAFTGITNLVFAQGSSLTLANNTTIGVNVENIYVEGNVIFAGYDVDKSGIGFKKDAEIYVASGKKLTVNHMSLTSLNSTTKLDVILMYAVNPTTSYVTWGQLDNKNGQIAMGKAGAVKSLNKAAAAGTEPTAITEPTEATADVTNGNGEWTVLYNKYYNGTSFVAIP